MKNRKEIKTVNENQKRIKELLINYRISKCRNEKLPPPAEISTIDEFVKRAEEHGVPADVIKHLVEIYQVSHGGLFHECDDMILFEWWEDDGSLWLASCDCDIIRWIDGKFCLGDASDYSYGDEYEFDNLLDLIEFDIIKRGADDYE